MTCVTVLEKCQRAGELREWGFDWTVFLAKRWRANHPFSDNDCIRPSTEAKQNGFEYKATSGGQSNGRAEPKWAKDTETVGESYVDGSVLWTAQELSFDSLEDRISAHSWTAPAGGPTVSDEVKVDQVGQQASAASFTGGTVGETYDIVNEITTVGGKKYHAILRLTIE